MNDTQGSQSVEVQQFPLPSGIPYLAHFCPLVGLDLFGGRSLVLAAPGIVC